MLAEAESCERLYVIRIITTFDEARASIRGRCHGNARKSRTMRRKTHWKNSFCQPERPKFRSRRAAFEELRAWLRRILFNRWKPTCLSCR